MQSFTRYLGNNLGFGTAGLTGLQSGLQFSSIQNANLRDAISTEQFVLDQLAARESAEQFAINQANGLGPIANRANLFAANPNLAQSNAQLLNFAAAQQTLAPFQQAAQAAGAQNAFADSNNALTALGIQGANLNGASPLITNSLLGQSILGPTLFQQQQDLAARLLGRNSSTPQNNGFGGFFAGNSRFGQPENPLGFRDRFGIDFGRNNDLSIAGIDPLNGNNGTTRRLSIG